jgi:hypothetical protein
MIVSACIERGMSMRNTYRWYLWGDRVVVGNLMLNDPRLLSPANKMGILPCLLELVLPIEDEKY